MAYIIVTQRHFLIYAKEVTIQRLTSDDLDLVYRFVKIQAQLMFDQIGSDPLQIRHWHSVYCTKSIWQKRLSNPGFHFLAILDKDKIVAAGYVNIFSDQAGVVFGQLGGLYVCAKGKGLGGLLMQKRIDIALQNKANYVQLETAQNNEAMICLAHKYKFDLYEQYADSVITHIPFLRYRLNLHPQ